MINIIEWKNSPSTETPINAENLNKIPKSFVEQVFEEASPGVFSNKVKSAKIADNATNVDAISINGKSLGEIFEEDGKTAKKTTETQFAEHSATSETAINATYAEFANNTTTEYQEKLYDITIRTQAEFEDLIASPTWLDATSVLFVGDGGTLEYVLEDMDNSGVFVPSSVKRIDGNNNAKIVVNNFKYNSELQNAAMWREKGSSIDHEDIYRLYPILSPLPLFNDTRISNLEVVCHSTSERAVAFSQFSLMENCVGVSIGGVVSIGFYMCLRLNRCVAKSIGGEEAGDGRGFEFCRLLNQCEGTGVGSGRGSGFGYSSCDGIVESKGYGLAGSISNAFFSCQNIVSSIGHSVGNHIYAACDQVTNCTAVTSLPTQVGYRGCSYGVGNSIQGPGTATSNVTKWSSEINDI